jgi:cytochrome c-type biogenesis protein CcmH
MPPNGASFAAQFQRRIMLFWIAIAALTAAATAALLAPLFRARRVTEESESEAAIYRDQLEEVERDVARGVLPESEAKAARTEIARRLIHASETSGGKSAEQPARRQIAFWLAIIAVPAICLGGYLALGSPGAGDRPIEGRRTNPAADDLFARFDLLTRAPTQQALADLEQLVGDAIVEAPNNAAVLQAAALVYYGVQRLDDAIDAYLRYLDIAGPDADPGRGFAFTLGEALAVSRGLTPEAEAMFRMVLDADPRNIPARLYLAAGYQDRGDNEAAIAAYLDLLELEPVGGAEWADIARTQLAALGVEPPPPPEEAPAFEGLTPEQLEMVNEMVGNLAARLTENPDDVEGWAQLIRSYMVLEREEEAFAALATAREFFTGNAEAMAVIEEVEAELARAMELE